MTKCAVVEAVIAGRIMTGLLVLKAAAEVKRIARTEDLNNMVNRLIRFVNNRSINENKTSTPVLTFNNLLQKDCLHDLNKTKRINLFTMLFRSSVLAILLTSAAAFSTSKHAMIRPVSCNELMNELYRVYSLSEQKTKKINEQMLPTFNLVVSK